MNQNSSSSESSYDRPYRRESGKSSHGGARRGGFRKSSFRRGGRKKICLISAERKGPIDYKDADFLAKFISERGKILPRSVTGACAKKQRELARALKKARAVGLLRTCK